MNLFRPAALQARQTSWLGEIVLARPLAFSALAAAAIAMGAAVAGLLFFASYTRHITVSGQLAPDSGLVKVYAPQPGIVMQSKVSEGQPVSKGQVLYVLSTERHDTTGSDVQASISRNVGLRAQSLRDERANTLRLQQEEQAALSRRIEGLRTELAKIDVQLEGQRTRVHLSEEALQRTQELQSRGYVSKEQLQGKQADLLDQRNRLQELERARIAANRELAAQQGDADSLPLRQQNQLAQLERLLASVGEEWTESEARRHMVVTAPESGIATAVTATPGQAASLERPLVSIVPARAMLQAQLFAPSGAVGFVKPGDQVLLRYQAYPYQKFGHAHGTVASVARTALPAADLSTTAAAGAGAGQPLYLITVALQRQSILAYGQPQPLQPGMLLDADIQQESRRLYEWALEPLYSLTGKF